MQAAEHPAQSGQLRGLLAAAGRAAALCTAILLAAPSLAQESAPEAPPSDEAPVSDDSAQMAEVATEEAEAGPPAGERLRTGEAAQPETTEPAPSGPKSDRLHVSLGVDFTNRYYFRGIVQEESGFIVQPWATLNADLIKEDSWTLQAAFGTWNSFHDTATNAASTDEFVRKWYEADFYGGLVLTCDKWTFKGIYSFYTSPSDAFETVEEASLTVGYDDTDLLGAWALHPALVLAVETGADFADGANSKQGIYLEPSICPGFTLEDGIGGILKGTAITFPVAIGLSLSDYYEDADGEDDTFGYASVAAKAAIPLGIPDGYGAWTLTLGVQGLFLGDHTSDYNRGDDAEFIASAGISIAF